MSASADKHMELTVKLSIEGLKAMLLVNAGAAASLIALTDKSGANANYSTAIIWFGIGALATVIAFVLGYYSQLNYANSLVALENKDNRAFADSNNRHVAFNVAAFVFVLIALASGTIGMGNAYVVAAWRGTAVEYAPPTMAEIFDMRSRCATAGQKLLDNDVHGPAVSVDQKSHYNPVSNRCFVELDSTSSGANLSGYEVSQYLYDGQTGELLGWFISKRAQANGPETLTCEVVDYANLSMKDELGNTGDARCRNINSRIIDLMTDDRTH